MTETKQPEEFIKHLRMVHFTLVVVCLALWATVFLGREQKISSALASIDDIKILLSNFGEGWKNLYFGGRANSPYLHFTVDTRRFDSDPNDTNYDQDEFAVPNPVGNYRVSWLKQGIDYQKENDVYCCSYDPPIMFRLSIMKEKNDEIQQYAQEIIPLMRDTLLIQITELESLRATARLDQSSMSQLVTLKQFREFWNTLHTDEHIEIVKVFPSAVAAGRTFLDLDVDVKESNVSNDREEFRENFLLESRQLYEEIRREYSDDHMSKEWWNKNWSKTERAILSKAELFLHYVTNNLVEVYIGVQIERTHGAALKSLLKFANPNLRAARFSLAFPELDGLTSNFQDSTLAQIQDMLLSPIFRGEQQLEIFAVKIPQWVATIVGGITLLGIQIYFLLHVSEFVRRTGQILNCWFPWIALYSSTPAHIMTFFTITLLPVATSIMLLVELIERDHWSIQVGYIFQILLTVVSMTIAIVTSRKIRLLRQLSRSQERN